MTVEEMFWPVTRLYDGYICRYMENLYNRVAEEISKEGVSGSILDAGTGPGRLPVRIAKLIPTVTITGIDVSADMIKIAQRNAKRAGVDDRARFIRRSVYSTGFGDSCFDFVVSTALVHHLSNIVQALNELHRVLKPQKEAWLYDGRRDASREEIRATVGSLPTGNLMLPLWIIERIWRYVHLGCKTETYTRGTVAKALQKSLFKDYEVTTEGAMVKIVLRKH